MCTHDILENNWNYNSVATMKLTEVILAVVNNVTEFMGPLVLKKFCLILGSYRIKPLIII